jgi:hypothetical protein
MTLKDTSARDDHAATVARHDCGYVVDADQVPDPDAAGEDSAVQIAFRRRWRGHDPSNAPLSDGEARVHELSDDPVHTQQFSEALVRVGSALAVASSALAAATCAVKSLAVADKLVRAALDTEKAGYHRLAKGARDETQDNVG